jgi:hypothetical protein
MSGIGPGIDAAAAALDLPRRAAALAVETNFAGTASPPTAAAMIDVPVEVDARSPTSAQASIAATLAFTLGADLLRIAGVAARAAMGRIAQGIDTAAGAA